MAPRVWFVIALALHLVAGFFYLMAGLIMPIYAVAVLWVVWIALAVVIVRRRDAGPPLLFIPFAAAVIWSLVGFLGDRFLGWTA